MLVMPKANAAMEKHIQERRGLTDLFNYELERILNNNKHKDKYWVLGKVKMHKAGNKTLARPFLQVSDTKPPLVRETFVYEVDNKRGVKELLWVFHPGDQLSFPTLGKSISVAGNKGATILTPK